MRTLTYKELCGKHKSPKVNRQKTPYELAMEKTNRRDRYKKGSQNRKLSLNQDLADKLNKHSGGRYHENRTPSTGWNRHLIDLCKLALENDVFIRVDMGHYTNQYPPEQNPRKPFTISQQCLDLLTEIRDYPEVAIYVQPIHTYSATGNILKTVEGYEYYGQYFKSYNDVVHYLLFQFDSDPRYFK